MREKLGHMTVVSEVSADPMGGLVAGIALQSCSKLRQALYHTVIGYRPSPHHSSEKFITIAKSFPAAAEGNSQ